MIIQFQRRFCLIFLFRIFDLKKHRSLTHNVKVLCDVAVSRHFTLNLIQMFNQGTNAEFCTSPAILQNTCYLPFYLSIMKYVSFILITLWACWMLIINGNLKPSDNYFLWILGVLSIMYSVINLVVFYVDSRSKNGR